MEDVHSQTLERKTGIFTFRVLAIVTTFDGKVSGSKNNNVLNSLDK